MTPQEKVGIRAEEFRIWESRRSDLLSLLNMLKAYAQPFAELQAWLTRVQQQLTNSPDDEICLEEGTIGYTELSRQAHDVLVFAVKCADLLDLDISSQIRGAYMAALRLEGQTFTAIQLAARLKVLEETIWEQLGNRKLLYVERPQFYEATWDFAPDEARDDVSEAGKCLALGRSTASVFFLMRIAEIGLRTLANTLGVTAVKKDRPLDLACWKDIFDAVEVTLQNLRTSKRTAVQDQALETYSALKIELRAFQDAWRDRVMHARVSYDPQQAESIYNHVRAFMERLAAIPRGLGEC